MVDSLKQLLIKALKAQQPCEGLFCPFQDIYEFSLKNQEIKGLVVGCLNMVVNHALNL